MIKLAWCYLFVKSTYVTAFNVHSLVINLAINCSICRPYLTKIEPIKFLNAKYVNETLSCVNVQLNFHLKKIY